MTALFINMAMIDEYGGKAGGHFLSKPARHLAAAR